jgi:hypothetical protein
MCACVRVPGHVKSSLLGVSLNIPVTNGRLNLGAWQGVYLNEHRNSGGWGGGHRRTIVVTVQGMRTKDGSDGGGGAVGDDDGDDDHGSGEATAGSGISTKKTKKDRGP